MEIAVIKKIMSIVYDATAQRIVISRIIISMLLFFTSIQAFDVKVLLLKNNIEDLAANPIELVCPQGFILSEHIVLSLGSECKSPHLTITSQGGVLLLNGKPVTQKLLYISPMLSTAHLMKLRSYVSCWLETYKQDLDLFAEPIYPLFDDIVAKNGSLKPDSYDVLDMYAKEVVHVFLQDFLQTIEGSHSIELPKLSEYAQQFFQEKAKIFFLESLAEKQLTQQDRKKLEKDKTYRYNFFLTDLHAVLQKLLVEFVPVLPRKILQQFLKENVGQIEFRGNTYLGSFAIFQEKQIFYLVNSLDIDDYLWSVLFYEGCLTWPHEMNKVFAITSRTYLVYHVLQAQKVNRPYHIGNDNRHQTYKGHFNSKKLKLAIEETKDLFISYDGKPALTQYDICCGGVIPGDIDDPNHKRVSYLARKYPCTFCKDYKCYTWHLDFSYDQILKRIQKEFPHVTKIVDIKVQKKDRAGIAKTILISTGAKKIVVTEKKWKTMFPELKSYCFEIHHANKRYSIKGKGFGHHKGLCQWGACSLVKNEHWNFEQVLQFYYPGTKLMKLAYQR